MACLIPSSPLMTYGVIFKKEKQRKRQGGLPLMELKGRAEKVSVDFQRAKVSSSYIDMSSEFVEAIIGLIQENAGNVCHGTRGLEDHRRLLFDCFKD